MKQRNNDDPNYRIVDKGIDSLSDAETLSVIISGKDSISKAQMILGKYDNNFNMIARLGYRDMVNEGFSHSQATRMIASNEYSKRKKIQEYPDKINIKQSSTVADIFFPILSDLQHEEFWVLYLSRSNKILAKSMISRGGLSGTVTDVRVIMKKAIEHFASGIIVCHNHPSGNTQPSKSDRAVTMKIKDAGSILDIQLLDHVIIAEDKYLSFADEGLL